MKTPTFVCTVCGKTFKCTRINGVLYTVRHMHYSSAEWKEANKN